MQQVGPGQWTVDTCLKSDRQIVQWLVLAPGTVWDLLLLLLPNNDFLHFPIMKLPVAACGGGQVNAIVCLPGNQEISLATVSSSSNHRHRMCSRKEKSAAAALRSPPHSTAVNIL